MIIKYSAQAADTWVTLGDDTTGTTPPVITGFLPRMSGVPLVDRMFQATNAKVRAAGNRQWEIRGTIATRHADYDTAADFVRAQAAAVPDFLDLQILQGATTYYLTPAVLVSFEPLISGISSVVTYGFIGSNLTATSP